MIEFVNIIINDRNKKKKLVLKCLINPYRICLLLKGKKKEKRDLLLKEIILCVTKKHRCQLLNVMKKKK